MSLQWSDFPNGQPGMYGTSTATMLNGTPWVGTASAIITSDPDSANFPNGRVLRHSSGVFGPEGAARLALTTPAAEVGVEFRFYCSQLPERTQGRTFIALNTTGDSARYNLTLLPNGGIRLYYGTDTLGPGTLIADTVSPVIFANSWNHLALKANVVTGACEVRKNGTPIAALTTTHGSPPGGTIGIVGFPDRYAGDSNFPHFFSKDIIVWNSLGTEINDFQGTVQVHDIKPTSDVTLGDWTSTGLDGYTEVDEDTPNDADYVTSGLTPTDPIEFGYGDLDPDVTSVRAVTMIMRGFNSDSGDGEVQMTASPDGGTSTDAGSAHFMTITPTFFWDHSTLSPATGLAWTPTEVNSLTVSFNRTT